MNTTPPAAALETPLELFPIGGSTRAARRSVSQLRVLIQLGIRQGYDRRQLEQMLQSASIPTQIASKMIDEALGNKKRSKHRYRLWRRRLFWAALVTAAGWLMFLVAFVILQ